MPDLYCDICGKNQVRAQILVEGAKLLACGACMRSGKVLHRFDDDEAVAPSVPSAPATLESGEEVAEGYGKTIRNARERMGLPIAVVAERINEKEAYLHGIEAERLMPTLEVAKKLEKELSVKLVEKVQASVGQTSSGSRSFTPPTLADMLETKKKKGK
ncbi:MAG: multiprotein-bridging factor 1 family protein [Candidatus ainarchaeum sp.]|nr:multiprotein-bridging factor 1 family protein [Candidatus ainarchaeum sp.]